jgi:DNA (cytosine-5)-methyltransferase 1
LRSGLTVMDQFCGAGGSSIGAQEAGLEIRLALNHWQLACDTYAVNHGIDPVCEDVSASDPRRYASTDILITSPECTNHSLAQGSRRKNQAQRELFGKPVDPSVERSRATMWDVVRFAEHHRYRIVIVENVVDVRMWELWDAWLMAMDRLGYAYKLVSLNSMFCHPTPQSRDRAYVVFWRKGNRAPDLEVRPLAHCPKCGDREAVQTWKRNSSSGLPNDAGRYKRQYVFTCSVCRREVTPHYYAALNAIDWSLAGKRIGDKKPPLKEKTLARVRYGLEKYGRRPLLIHTRRNIGTLNARVKSAESHLGTITGGLYFALASPFCVETVFTHDGDTQKRAFGADAPLTTQSTRQSVAMVTPFVTCAGSRETAPSGVDEPIPTLTGSDRFGVTVPPFLVTLRGTQDSQLPSTPVGMDEPIGTISAGGIHHAVVSGAAVLTMRDQPNLQLSEVTDPLFTQTASPQAALIGRAPFLVQYYGQMQASGIGEGMPTVTGLDRHALIQPEDELRVEDCYFRMLAPHELQAGMAFPADYRVLGNNREKVKQIGNAVTPPAMAWLIRRCVASLHPEVMS